MSQAVSHDHDHERCFQSSDLPTPCTMLELMTWASEMYDAGISGKIRIAQQADLVDIIVGLEEQNDTHSFNLEAAHIAAINSWLLGIQSAPDDYDGPVYEGQRGERLKSPADRLGEFYSDVLQCLVYPFSTWPRILLDARTLTVRTAGFAVNEFYEITWWRPNWTPWPELANRDPEESMSIGCPSPRNFIPASVLEAVLADETFIRQYFEKHRNRLAEMLGKALSPQLMAETDPLEAIPRLLAQLGSTPETMDVLTTIAEDLLDHHMQWHRRGENN